MKRAISLIMALILCLSLMSGCCLSHEWVEADCNHAKHCAKCDKTEGESLGHDWEDADCENPKTCDRCDKTKGDALGHDWKDADCVTPKTCNRCEETEGEALGHSYSGWKVTGTDMMVSNCAACGDAQEAPLDREIIGHQQLIGKWELTAATVNGTWYDLSLDWTLEFYEDGTFEFMFSEPKSGETVYVEFYVGEYMDFYVFDCNTTDHTYSVNYEPGEDVVLIAAGEIFEFSRVTE